MFPVAKSIASRSSPVSPQQNTMCVCAYQSILLEQLYKIKTTDILYTHILSIHWLTFALNHKCVNCVPTWREQNINPICLISSTDVCCGTDRLNNNSWIHLSGWCCSLTTRKVSGCCSFSMAVHCTDQSDRGFVANTCAASHPLRNIAVKFLDLF